MKNCESVGEAIKSIAAQTYPHELLEIIIIDGGSKDNTLSVIANEAHSLTDIRLRIFSDDGRGLGSARQMAVDHAQSDYMLWVDSDATITKNYVSSLVEFIEGHPDHGGARGIQEVNNQTGLLPRLESLSLVLRRAPRPVFDTNGQIFRVQAVKGVGGFDGHIRGAGEDVDLILRMMRVGWLFTQIQSKFNHKVGPWKEIYQKRVRAGYGLHYLRHKHGMIGSLLNQIFFVSLIVGVRDATSAYRLTGQKISFLLPFWYCLKDVPWWIGFSKSHIDGYGHACHESRGSSI